MTSIASSKKLPGESRRRILLVESQEDQAIYWTAVLSSLGYDVIQASSVQVAKSLLAPYLSIVVCGSYLEDGRAIELFAEVRRRRELSLVYLILLTSSIGEAEVIESLKSGANDCMDKGGTYGEVRARFELAERVIALNDELQRKSHELSHALSVIEAELSAAAKLQTAMLPESMDFDGLEIRTVYRPSNFLGGDMIAITRVGDAVAAFCLIDVVGHGTAAALISCSLIREMMDRMVEILRGAGDAGIDTCGQLVIEKMNRRYCKLGIPDTYFTAVAGAINARTGKVSYCQAGHPSLISLKSHGDVQLLEKSGFPVGLFIDAEYSMQHVELADKQMLIIPSDGLLRPLPADPGGVQAIIALLRANEPQVNIIADQLQEFAAQLEGPDRDDQSALVIRYSNIACSAAELHRDPGYIVGVPAA